MKGGTQMKGGRKWENRVILAACQGRDTWWVKVTLKYKVQHVVDDLEE